MVTPGRAFRGLFPVPDTLKWMRVAVTPTADGGADVALEAGDKSPGDAEQHAAELTRALDQARTIDMLLTRIDVIDHTEFSADGDVIKAQVHVTGRQLKLILGFAEQQLRAFSAQHASPATGMATPSAPTYGDRGSASPSPPPLGTTPPPKASP